MKTITRLWIVIIIFTVLTPVGLILPKLFKAGAAWGEWRPREIAKFVGYVPKGLERLASLWAAPLPGYAFNERWREGLWSMGFGYIVSAIAGVLVILCIIFLIGKFLGKKE